LASLAIFIDGGPDKRKSPFSGAFFMRQNYYEKYYFFSILLQKVLCFSCHKRQLGITKYQQKQSNIKRANPTNKG